MPLISCNKIQYLFENSGKELYYKAENTISKFSMTSLVEKGVVVGFSGGADSIFLLGFLLEYRRRNNLDFPILAVHINHGIRGEEADRDQVFCFHVCKMLNVDFVSSNFDIPTLASSAGLGIEEMARNVRYAEFKRIIEGRKDISSIAVAHNMSDNAETVIFNILRGSGAKGASGIPPVRDNVIRPLIEISKQEILDALDLSKIPYMVDSTNLYDEYTRNYIRSTVVPSFKKVCENPEDMIARFADNLRSDEEFISSVASDFLEQNPVITAKALRSLHYSVYVRVIKSIAKNADASISAQIIRDIWNNLSKNNFSYSIINAKFVCDGGICYITKSLESQIDYCVFPDENLACIDEIGVDTAVSSKMFVKSFLNVYKKSIQVNLSSAIINGRIYFRPKKDGDVIYYGGMTRKVKKLFNDRKIPTHIRKKYPVLCDDSGVLWVPGFGVRDDGVLNENKKDYFVFLGEKI